MLRRNMEKVWVASCAGEISRRKGQLLRFGFQTCPGRIQTAKGSETLRVSHWLVSRIGCDCGKALQPSCVRHWTYVQKHPPQKRKPTNQLTDLRSEIHDQGPVHCSIVEFHTLVNHWLLRVEFVYLSPWWSEYFRKVYLKQKTCRQEVHGLPEMTCANWWHGIAGWTLRGYPPAWQQPEASNRQFNRSMGPESKGCWEKLWCRSWKRLKRQSFCGKALQVTKSRKLTRCNRTRTAQLLATRLPWCRHVAGSADCASAGPWHSDNAIHSADPGRVVLCQKEIWQGLFLLHDLWNSSGHFRRDSLSDDRSDSVP